MAAGGLKGKSLLFRVKDDFAVKRVKAIVRYENEVNGQAAAATLSRHVMSAARIDEYPEEMKQLLRELGSDMDERELARFLCVDKL